MKQKYVMPLAVIFLILLGLVVAKQYNKKDYTITDQVKLTSLVPDGLGKADIVKLELFLGAKAADKVVLDRDPANPDVWWISSHFNAPANKEKVEEFLDKALALKGEPRDPNAGDAALASYDLKDDAGFHVKAYKKGETNAALDVLVGKAPAMDQVFMRAASSKDVYLLDANLKREAGIFQDDATAAPTAEPWLKKEVVNIAKNTISKVVVTTPDKRVVVSKEKKEVPADPAKPADPNAPADAAKPADPAKPEEKPADASAEKKDEKPATKIEEKWVLSEGGAGLEVKPAGIENLAGAFAPLTASDIVDPAKLADWGLEQPQFTCTISVEGKTDGDVVLEGGRPDPNGDGYVRVASANKAIIFKLSKFTFEKVFPKGTDLFTLKGLTVDKAQIAKIDLTQPSGTVSLTKQGEDWTIVSPACDLKPQKPTLDAIANLFSAWTPSDFADKADGTGLEAPTHTATVTLASGETHTVVLGGPSKGIAGAYARLDNAPGVLVMSKGDIDRGFPAPKDLYQRKLLDIVEEDINSISVQRASDSFQIARAGEGWTLTVDGAAAESNVEGCNNLATEIADFEASDIVFGQTDIVGEPVATLHCVMKDGTDHVFRFGAEESGSHPLALSGKAQVFRAEKLPVESLLVSSASLKKAAPAPATPDAGTGAPVPAAPVEGAPAAPAENMPATVQPAPVPAPAEPAPAPAPAEPAPAPAPAEPAPAPAPAEPAPAPAPAEPAPAPAPAEPAPAPAPAEPAPAPAPAEPAPAPAPAPATPATP